MALTGETLRSERLRRGWTLEQIAAETKIGLHMLEAIEDDQIGRLPCGMLARSFVRQYAQALGLNEDEVLASFKEQLEHSEAPPPEPKLQYKSARIPYLPTLHEVWERLSAFSISSVVLPLVLIFACVGIYNSIRQGWQSATASVTGAPKPELPKPATSDKGTIVPAIQPPPQPVRPIPDESVPAQDVSNGVRVALSATEPVWISIKSDGTHVFSGTLQAQQTRQFDATSKMMLIAGNAGGLAVSVNGKPVGPIGPHGEIRLLELTQAGAHIVPRPPPAAPPPTENPAADRPSPSDPTP